MSGGRSPRSPHPTSETQSLITKYAGVAPLNDLVLTQTFEDDCTRAGTSGFAQDTMYTAGPMVSTEINASTQYDRYHHADMIGSTVQLSDGSGGPAIPKFNQAYSAFGEKIDDRFGDGESMSTRYQYAGGWGYESGLIVLEGAEGSRPIELLHVGARWYDPGIGRFVQRDPIGTWGDWRQVGSASALVASSPLQAVDPLGLKLRVFPERRLPYTSPGRGFSQGLVDDSR